MRISATSPPPNFGRPKDPSRASQQLSHEEVMSPQLENFADAADLSDSDFGVGGESLHMI